MTTGVVADVVVGTEVSSDKCLDEFVTSKEEEVNDDKVVGDVVVCTATRACGSVDAIGLICCDVAVVEGTVSVVWIGLVADER